MYSIYRIVNFKNGKVYVGQSLDVAKRKQSHFALLRCGKHPNRRLQNAYWKYGGHSFYFEILETNISERDIDSREIYWISIFDSFANGYNQTTGGEHGFGMKRACEWNGIQYPSLKVAAETLGISQPTMSQRLRKGWKRDADMPVRFSSGIIKVGNKYIVVRQNNEHE